MTLIFCSFSTQKLLSIVVYFFFFKPSQCQNLYFQDTFRGGVTGGGYNSWLTSNPYTIDLNLDDQSSIRRAFLFTGVYGQPASSSMFLNNNEIKLTEDLYSSQIYTTQSSDNIAYNLYTTVIDVTEFVNTGQIDIIPPINQPPLNVGRFVQFYILILYENLNLPETSVSVFLNEQNCSGIMNYQLNGFNSINPNHPVGLAINGAQMCNTDIDGSEVYVNDNYIGLIGGNDISSPNGCGVSGGFYYDQNLFFGLGDDVANNTVDGSDAIANIQSYLTNNSQVDVSFVYQSLENPPNPNAQFSNVIWQLYLVYSSTCTNMDFSLLTSDTTVCAGVPLQLGASGGTTSGSFQAYEWLPQQNLSCYDCPNPVFLGDSTMNYTVRIRNTDSCSVVYPVRVRVLPKPNFESIEITESICGGASGEILARPVSEVEPPHLFQLNGANTQLNEANYPNLSPGFYTLTLTDGNACKRDSIVEIGEFNNVLADFSVNPSTGAAPLDIQISNQSQNASQYFWDFSDEDGNTISQTNGPFDSAQCPLAGVYTLTLIATNGFEHCADTASLTILVYDTLQVVVPNVFTPNNDGSNDWFGITATLDTELQIVLLNRWGNVMLEKQITLSANTFTPLWDGQNAPDGVYFYKIVLTSENMEMNGFVELRR